MSKGWIKWSRQRAIASPALLPQKLPFYLSLLSDPIPSPPPRYSVGGSTVQNQLLVVILSFPVERARQGAEDSALGPRPSVQGYGECQPLVENESHVSPGPTGSSSPAQHYEEGSETRGEKKKDTLGLCHRFWGGPCSLQRQEAEGPCMKILPLHHQLLIAVL